MKPWWSMSVRSGIETQSQIIFINSSLLILASLAIFLKMPLPSSSPLCMGTTVMRPSGCFITRWLPCCLMEINPIFARAFTIISALTGFSNDYLHTHEFRNIYVFFSFEIRLDRFFCSFQEFVHASCLCVASGKGWNCRY